MRQRSGPIARCAVLLFGGYLLLFLLRLDPYPRSVPGLLVIALPDYVRAAAQFDPVVVLNQRLGISAALLGSLGLLGVLVFLFVVYFRLLQAVRLQSEPDARVPVENPRSHKKSHEEEPNVVDLCVHSQIKKQPFVALRGPSWIAKHPAHFTSLGAIMAGVLLFSLPLLLCPYLFSRDIYSYISYGRIAALYGENPVLTAPSAYPHDAFFAYLIAWQSTPSVYGPVWALFSHGLTLLVERAGGALWLYLLAYKLAMLVAHIASTMLIWQIMRAWRPGQQLYATLLYAWNPVALIEFVGSAHNDVLMIALILLAVLCTQRGHWRSALVALLAAVLVKWVAVLLLPLWMIYWLQGQHTWRGRLRLMVQAAAIVLVGTALLYMPYGHVLRSLSAPLLTQAGMPAENSLSALAIHGGQEALVRLGVVSARDAAWRPAAEMVVAWCSRILVLLVWLAALYAVWRRPTFARLLETSFWLLLVLLLIAPIFRVWYVTWPLALAALLNWRPAGRAVVSLVVAAPFLYIQAEAPEWMDALIVLPVIVLLIYELVCAYRRRAANGAPAPIAVVPRAEAITEKYL